MDNQEQAEGDFVALTADFVSAYVGNNSVSLADLPNIIASVYASLTGLTKPAREPEAAKPVPPVPIKKSVTPDYLISLEDGRNYKSLKRHLAGRGMTPAEYREKWGLPRDYPMVAASYAAKRSELAKALGLGRKAKAEQSAPAEEASKRRGRKKAA